MTESASAPRLSVVIPAFDEEERLGPTLAEVSGYLRNRGDRYEILGVDDASTDGTVAVA